MVIFQALIKGHYYSLQEGKKGGIFLFEEIEDKGKGTHSNETSQFLEERKTCRKPVNHSPDSIFIM